MMKRMFILMTAALIAIAGVSSASAYQISVTLDKDDYTVGDTLFAEVNFIGLSTDPDNIAAFGVDLVYDLDQSTFQGVLDYKNAVFNSAWTLSTAGGIPGNNTDATWESVGFSGTVPPFPPAGLTGDPLYLFTAEFEVISVGDGTLDIFSGDSGTGDNIINQGFEGLDADVVFGAAGDSATIVPIPGAVILLGSGLLGLIGIRRRR
jgi:hypothetical protein